jgi:type I restriction enzyme S subunit
MTTELKAREAPASYLVELEEQRVRPGYKQTEVGVIPEDWEVMALGEIGDVRMCKRVLKQQTREHGDVPFYKIGTFGDVADAFISYALFDEFRRKYSFPKKGDVLISAAGTIGRTVPFDGAPAYFQDSNIVWIENDESKATNAFLWHCYQVTKWAVSHGGTVARLYNDNLRTKIYVPVPPLPEQRAIAAALSDVDALLAKLDQLIAKKRDLKQAAMQQLLTGSTRLPGFGGEWEVKTLGDLFNFSGGYSASRDQLSSEGYCYLHYGDIHGASKMWADTRVDYQDIPKLNIPLKRVSSSALLKDGDVVFVDASEDDEGASKHVVVVNKDNVPFISGLHTIVAKSKTEELAHEYRQYCFQTAAIRQQFLFYAVGTKVTGISKTNIAKLRLLVPPLKEQTAIATILSDMDAEIAALEARRDKTRDLKQGMMQELLTGRIRLV